MSVCAIKGILLKTRISSADPRTLSDRWKLSSAEELEDVATCLFAASSGQPRKIIKSRINLTQTVTDADEDAVPARTVVSQCHLLWEGTVEDSHNSAHRMIMNIVIGVLRPSDGTDTVRANCCFDEFVGVQVSSQVKAQPNPWLGSYYVDQERSFHSESFQPKDWPALIQHLQSRLEDSDDQFWSCFRAPKLTVVPDVIVLARMSNIHHPEQKLSPKLRMLRLGLAVVKLAVPVNDSIIFKECQKFENLLAKLDDLEIRNQEFVEVCIPVENDFTTITHVLLLNLTTAAMRAAFFGFNEDSVLAKTVESMVERSKMKPLYWW
ncbi:hypothetical protein GQ600_19440 [Phytophthora cactorum]|nr:hypothetical protein GQ600_19440 [Phytophthora cactorum]